MHIKYENLSVFFKIPMKQPADQHRSREQSPLSQLRRLEEAGGHSAGPGFPSALR